MTTWLVCARKDRARIYQCSNIEDGLDLVREMPEEGEPPARGDFVDTLCSELESRFEAKEFDHLVLAAEHPVLVPLRSRLSQRLKNRVIGAVDLDVYDDNESDLINYVTNFIIQEHRSEKSDTTAA